MTRKQVREVFQNYELNMSNNSEEDESLPENPVCSECEKLKKEFDFTTTLDDNDTKPVYQKDGFICSKCGEKKYFHILT